MAGRKKQKVDPKQTYYWLGPGVVKVNGKDYGAGAKLPLIGICPKSLQAMLDADKIGVKAPTVLQSNLTAQLQKEVNNGKQAVTKLTHENNELQKQLVDFNQENNTLAAEKEVLEGQVEQLTAAGIKKEKAPDKDKPDAAPKTGPTNPS